MQLQVRLLKETQFLLGIAPDRDLRRATKMSGAGAMNQQEDKPRKPEEKPASDHVNIKVNGQDGSEVFFKVGKKTQLRKLMKAYCERQAVDQRTVAFLLDGHAITGNQTPEELELADGDELDAMLHHGGGGAICVFL